MKKRDLLDRLKKLEQWVESRAEVNDRGDLAASDLQELHRRLQTLVVQLPG
jgi:hypothetical protein